MGKGKLMNTLNRHPASGRLRTDTKNRMLQMAFVGLLILISLLTMPAHAQEAAEITPEPAPDTGVWVTTQDNVALREGPGQAFVRVAVVPSETTIPAIGRTTTGEWIQVYYEGKTGWIAAFLLVWSGDLVGLPADGINPVPFVRKLGPIFTVTNSMAIHNQENFGPGVRVDFPAESAQVEITARLGAGESYWLQFWYSGAYYWLGDWNLHLDVRGSYFDDVPDASYVYPFGRLYGKIAAAYDESIRSYYRIRDLWNSLATGNSISCNNLPTAIVGLEYSQADLDAEAVFIPAVRALEAATSSTNSAIDRLATACGDTNRFLTTDTVNAALTDLTDARRSFDLLGILLPPIANRDPALGG